MTTQLQTGAGTRAGLRESFARDGFVHVPGVLDAARVAELRGLCRTRLEGARDTNDVFNRFPDMRDLLVNPTTLDVLRTLLGDDFVLMRESAIHHGQFGGWHKDTTSQERAGKTFQWDPDYLQVTAAYYLQDNTDRWAGGLDLDPGSHRRPDQFINPASLTNPSPDGEPVSPAWQSVVNRAGDFVVFDMRTVHRATQPDETEFPPEHEKFACFMNLSANTRHVALYHDYIGTRPDYPWMAGFAWADGMRALAADHGFGLA